MSKTFKFLNARQEGQKDTEMMARSASDKLDLTLAQMDLRGPLDQHGKLRVMDIPSVGDPAAEVFSVTQAGEVSIASTLAVTGMSTLAEAKVSDLAQHGIVISGADGRLDTVDGLTYQATSGLNITGTLDASGDFAISDKFVVTATDGATSIAGVVDFASALRMAHDSVDGSYWFVSAAGEQVQFGDLSIRSTYGDANSDVFKVLATDGSVSAAGGELTIADDGALAIGSVFSVDANGALKAHSIADMEAGALWQIDTAGQATLVSIAAKGGLFSMAANGKITGQALSAGNDKFQVMSDGTKITLNDGEPTPADVFEVSDSGAIKAHSIEDIATSSQWSISTEGEAVFQELTAKENAHMEKALQVDGILSQNEDLRLKSDKALRFWDSSDPQNPVDQGFIKYLLDDSGAADVKQIVIDPSPAGAAGRVVIQGDLQVMGATTTVESTTVEISDLLFRVGKDAADLAAANGAGLEVGNDLASFKYVNADSRWSLTNGLLVAAKIDAADMEAVGEVKGATLDITTSAVLASAKVSDLSAGRVVLAGTDGELEDNGKLTFSDTTGLNVSQAATISGDLSASSGKFEVKATDSLVKIKDYGLNIIDATGAQPVVKASISAAGAMDLAGTADIEGRLLVGAGNNLIVSADGDLSIKPTGAASPVFSVAADSGDTVVAGTADVASDLKVNTDKFTVTATDGAVNLKGRLSSDSAWFITSAGAMDLSSSAAIGGDLSVATDKFSVTAASGNVNLKGDLSSDQVWSISSAGAISAVSAELSGDLKASSEKFHVDTSGAKVNISGYSLHIDDADPSSPSDVFKVSASGDLDADGIAQLFKYTDSLSQTEMYAFRVYDANSGMGGTSNQAMPAVLSNVGMTVVGQLSAQSGLDVAGMISHTGDTASFAQGALYIQGASMGGGSNTVPGGSAGGGGVSSAGSIKASVNILPELGSGANPVMPDLGSTTAEWENVYAKNLHAEAMNLDSLLFTGDAPAAPAEGQLWYDSTAGKLKFYDDERIHVVGESDITELSEREISMNHYAETGDDGQNAELRIYRHEAGNERATSVAIKSAGSTQEQGSEMILQSGLLLHDQAEADKPSSGRNINLDKNILVDVSMFEILVIDGANDGFSKFDAEVHQCPFGQAVLSQAANTEYDGHIEMKDRELGWVILSGDVATSLPSFGDSLYYGAGTHAGKAVDYTTADGHVDANGQSAGFVIEIGHVLKTADITDNLGNSYKCAYVQFCHNKKYQN